MAVMKLRQSGRRVIFFLSALLFSCVIFWAYYGSSPGSAARLREALGGRKAVPIFVQDEHQDALPRWYEFAAQHGGLSEMSLVHIDAHSDMAIPSKFARNPGTRMQAPFDRDSIRTSNDEFIEESVQSHLVGRVTWIVPDWGVENESGMFGHEWEDGYVHPERAAIGVGFEKSTDHPCDCILNGRWRAPGARPRYSCSSASDDDLSKEDCVLINRVPLEAMIGSRVLARGITIHDATLDVDDAPNVILDIDEDYFVTADPVGPLLQAGWNNMSLGLLDDILMRLCVEDAVSEQWLAERIIDATYGRPLNLGGVARGKFICPRKFLARLDRHVPESEMTLEHTLTAYRRELDLITADLTPKQRQAMLDALVDGGFGITPRSERGTGPEFPAPMCITTGVDQERGSDESLYAKNSLVMFHTPNDAELDRELDRLREYLLSSGIGEHVRVVTLCRSLRDGYLPRRLWKRIESHVLETLELLLPSSYVVMDGRPSW